MELVQETVNVLFCLAPIVVVEFIVDITIALQEEKTIGNVIILEDVIPPAKPYCKVIPLLNFLIKIKRCKL